ncbi:MAG: hypothetical protein O7H41_18330 [Planctomycetota bacterium]|nr:hypothetical protein [Planctomycetota bacterium]
MSKNGCTHCGRLHEEEAYSCPKCGLEMPTKGHAQVFERLSGIAQGGGTFLGIWAGLTVGAQLPAIDAFFFGVKLPNSGLYLFAAVAALAFLIPGILMQRAYRKGVISN